MCQENKYNLLLKFTVCYFILYRCFLKFFQNNVYYFKQLSIYMYNIMQQITLNELKK